MPLVPRIPLVPSTIAICALALLAGACSTAVARNDDGTILARGRLAVFAMRVGDCFDDPDELVSGETLELDEVLAVPCAEPHDNEVFALFDLPDGESAPYPGDDFVYSLYLPDYEFVEMAFPGRPLIVEITTYSAGTSKLRGSQMCGFTHKALLGDVVVQTPEDFRRWTQRPGPR